MRLRSVAALALAALACASTGAQAERVEEGPWSEYWRSYRVDVSDPIADLRVSTFVEYHECYNGAYPGHPRECVLDAGGTFGACYDNLVSVGVFRRGTWDDTGMSFAL